MANRMEERYHDALDRVEKLEAEVKRLHQYESMVHYIDNDYIELSYEKAQCQRDDWLKRCRKTIAEAPLEWTENYGQGSEPWLDHLPSAVESAVDRAEKEKIDIENNVARAHWARKAWDAPKVG